MQLLTEASKGCLMAVLAPHDAVQFVEWCDANIHPDDLAKDGMEREIHVTVAYGFVDVTPDDVREAISGIGRVAVTLGDVTKFDTSPEHDVLKIDVHSPDLENLHYTLRDLFGKSLDVTFKEYHPHLTLAYVKKGACADLVGHGKFSGNTYVFTSLVYSEPDSKRKHAVAIEKN
jgi:2'-5' RNA ligase